MEDIRQFQDATIEGVRTVTLNLKDSTAYSRKTYASNVYFPFS